jgi:large subunit ribosomal protein L23
MANITEILLKPLITEKASKASEKFNRYGFVVALSANKNNIKEAVEKLYDVKVLKIVTSVRPGKSKRRGANSFKTSKVKNAFVQLSEGQKIEFFKGV